MAENKVQDYGNDNDDGDVDTRKPNFKCESCDPRLGGDMGIDAQG